MALLRSVGACALANLECHFRCAAIAGDKRCPGRAIISAILREAVPSAMSSVPVARDQVLETGVGGAFVVLVNLHFVCPECILSGCGNDDLADGVAVRQGNLWGAIHNFIAPAAGACGLHQFATRIGFSGRGVKRHS
jgi:stage V sporulation protein SpoVS